MPQRGYSFRVYTVTFYFLDGFSHSIRAEYAVCIELFDTWREVKTGRREGFLANFGHQEAAQPPAAQRRMVDLGQAYRVEVKPGA